MLYRKTVRIEKSQKIELREIAEDFHFKTANKEK